jgi:4'-phosphopantetheinyl transferase
MPLHDLQVPPLAGSSVHVWQVPLDVAETALPELAALLSVDERGRADRFAFPELRRRFVVARARLRQLLGAYSHNRAEDLKFVYGTAGKPALAGGEWEFNVSHAGERALVAVAGPGRGVGVDLEFVHPMDFEKIGRAVFTEMEIRLLQQSPVERRAETFLRMWVRHEAQVKAVGSGIGTRAEVPVYDLKVERGYQGALAADIPDVRIEMYRI